MKLLYISSPEHAKTLHSPWHGLDLGNGKTLVCVRWTEEGHEMEWASHPDVIRLPHPIHESTTPLGDEAVQHLNGRYQLQASHTVHHVIKQASAEDPWMRLYVL